MKSIKYFIIILIFTSCINKESIREKNIHQIVNLIYSDFSQQEMEFYVFPVSKPPLNSVMNNDIYNKNIIKPLTKKDSLIKINQYLNNKKNQQIFAFNLKMERYHNLKNKIIPIKNDDFKNLYNEFIKSNKLNTLNINKIIPKNNDSIIQLKRENLDFKNNNIIISFSNIVFNNDFSKSIIIATKSWSALDSYSLIYFLEKRNNIWVVTFKKTL